MKAAVLYGPRDVRVEEVETAGLLAGDVLIRIRACGICGSDLHTYKHGLLLELGAPVNSGRILGHEFSGDVAEINGQVEGLKVGDRVTCVNFGANAEYLRIPAAITPAIFHVPPEVSYEEAATTEPLANSVHAVGLASPVDGETVVVIGAGIIGLGVVQVLKAVSSTKIIIVVDLSDKRLAMAKQLGADVVINAASEDPYQKVLEITGSTPISFAGDQPAGNVDIVFDCAGASREHAGPPPLQQALMMVRENGKVVLVAVSERPFEIESNAIMRKGVRLFGSWAWSLDEFGEALKLMQSGKVARKQLTTHEFPLDRAKEAYETQLKAEEAIKVLIKP
jgi:2-desacetyl-2-hydroxyethyl bacteriochlorophyllide A dehydrogenase